MVARKFLYVMVVLVVLVIAGAFAYRFYGNDLIRMALVPGETFRAQPGVAASAYDDRRMWLARPDLPGNPASWTPPADADAREAVARPGTGAAIFFVHPTSYVSRDHWNAPLNDPETNDRAALFLRGQASALNAAGEVWAPRYRQATFGAFLTSVADSERALTLAYRDVAAAFDSFLRQVGPTRPIILAGHSQGSIHLLRLLRERIATDPALRTRIVAAYAIGWPISRTVDLPRLGLPECREPTQTGCLLSWVTFAEPAGPALVIDRYDRTTGFDGRPRAGTPIVCTNPLAGRPDVTAPAAANLGTLYPAKDLSSADIVAGKVPARCAGRGVLLIGDPPAVGPYVLPGNNYHVYDYSLFWANVRADAVRRLRAFPVRRTATPA